MPSKALGGYRFGSEITMMNLIDKIQKELSRLGITQKDFETNAQIPQNRMSKWKSGQGEPTARQLLRISRVLKLPMEYLADDSVEEPHSLTQLPDDEASVLRYYRLQRDRGGLDEADAISGLAMMVRMKTAEVGGPPVVLTGQAALDAIAASKPGSEPPVVHHVSKPKSAPPRKKA